MGIVSNFLTVRRKKRASTFASRTRVRRRAAYDFGIVGKGKHLVAVVGSAIFADQLAADLRSGFPSVWAFW